MSTNLRIEVRTGEAERKRVDFTLGTPVEAFSVGAAASWAVKGDGVVGVHAYFYFDGTTLFVASVGGAPVTMAGQSVGTDWVPVDVPMNVHIGGAKLAVRGPTSHRTGEETQQRAQAPLPEEDEKTHFKTVPNSKRRGPRGAVLAPGPAAPAPPAAEFEAPPDSEATVVQRPDEQALRATRPQAPAVEPLPESEKTRIAPVEARAPAPLPAAGQPPPGMAPGGAPHVVHQSLAAAQEPPTTRRAPLPAAGAPPPGVMPGGAPMPGAPMGAPMPGAPMPGAPMPGAPMPGAPMGAPMPGAQGGVPGFVVQPGQAPVVPGAAPGGAPPKPGSAKEKAQKLKAQAAKAWKEASVAQKAILVLLPFAFIAMFSLMGGPAKQAAAPTANSASPVGSGSAAQASSATPPVASVPKPVASVPPAAVASSAVKHAPAPPSRVRAKAKAKGKSEERLAVDAVAAGNYEEALKHYQVLAAAHPDEAVYQKAIRILKRKIAQQ